MTVPLKFFVTVDNLVFAKNGQSTVILLIQRKNDPFKDQWALPGGFWEEDERIEQAARRELREETGLKIQDLVLSGVYGNATRDPRGQTITVAYLSVLPKIPAKLKPASDAKNLEWHDVESLPVLAFDHEYIISDGIARIKEMNKLGGIEFDL